MVLISHRYKFIYLAGYKVASTSVASFFERYCLPEDQQADHEPKCESRLITTKAGFIGPRPSEKGFTPVILEEPGAQSTQGAQGAQGILKVPRGMDRASFANSIPPMFSHLPLSKLLNTSYINLTFKQLKQYYKFTVVRNPWDVQVSMYHYIVKDGGPFDTFVKQLCTVNSDVYSLNGKPACDFYIRYENLENDIRTVCNTLNIKVDSLELPNHRTTSRADKKEYRKYYTDELRDYVAKKCAVEIEMFGYTF